MLGSVMDPSQHIYLMHFHNRASLVAQMVKNLLTIREIWVQSLGWEDLPEKEMATPSSIPAWRIPWMEEPGGSCSMQLNTVWKLDSFFVVVVLLDPQE